MAAAAGRPKQPVGVRQRADLGLGARDLQLGRRRAGLLASGRLWVKVWLPIQWPSACARSAQARASRFISLLPITKKVVRTLRRASTSSTIGVTEGSGPLSNVTVRSNMRTRPFAAAVDPRA